MACNNKNYTSPAICCTNNNTSEKNCIEVKKVFDACMQQRSISTTLNVTFTGDTTGYTVTGVQSSGDAVISDLNVTPLAGSTCSRVSLTLTVPVTVVATNSAGLQIIGTSSMTLTQDIVLKVPADGVIAPRVESTVVIVGLQNSLISSTEVTTNACVTIITKVVADVILVVPTYGYPILPPCQEYTQDVCSGVFSAPVFPR